MADVIAFANQKGGVGKSTLAVQAAYYFQLKLGKKVLLIDMDAQGNSSSSLLGESDFECSPSEALFDADAEIKVQKTITGVDIIGSNPNNDDGYDTESLPLETIYNPKKHLEQMVKKYDYVFIDCPPSLGRRLAAALIMANFVICPVKLSGYATNGIVRLFRTLMAITEESNPNLRVLGFVINEYDGSASHHMALEETREQIGDLIFENMLHHRSPVDSASRGMPIWTVRNGYRAAEELAAIWKEMLKKIKENR